MSKNQSKNKYKYCGIYRIKIDKYEYIGQSIDITNRIKQHKKKLKLNCHSNDYMQRVYNKYQTFEYKILFKVEKEFLTILEQVCINLSKNNMNLAPAGKTYYKTEEQKKTLSEAMKSSEKVKKVLEKIHSQPKTKAQREASKKNVHSMNTKEANQKSAQSRKNNSNVIAARRKREDPNIYIFVNKKTNEEWKGLRVDFREYLKVNNASARVSEILRGKSFRGWQLKEGQEFNFKSPSKSRSNRGITNAGADKAIYSFIHSKTEESFIGTRYEFANYIQVSSKQLSGLIHMRDKTYHKWSLNCCSLNYCPCKTP